ncbi:hypothetical protein QAD02_016963 [Eretmocerus hayati]|uniref:Uncharacterized protein n=1 Tax=Eretmocerus hayati TaxID=131215 RepID=A0ACC2PEE2_9HYME|nr:hypothetical protein QAD02_016963 [Eretmocerus hayati]
MASQRKGDNNGGSRPASPNNQEKAAEIQIDQVPVFERLVAYIQEEVAKVDPSAEKISIMLVDEKIILRTSAGTLYDLDSHQKKQLAAKIQRENIATQRDDESSKQNVISVRDSSQVASTGSEKLTPSPPTVGPVDKENQVPGSTARSNSVDNYDPDLRNQVSNLCTQVSSMAKVTAEFQKTVFETLGTLRDNQKSQSEEIANIAQRLAVQEVASKQCHENQATKSGILQADSIQSRIETQQHVSSKENGSSHNNSTQSTFPQESNKSSMNLNQAAPVLAVQTGHHSIKRDYKLTRDEKWEFFLDKLLLELNSLNISYITSDLTTISPISELCPIAEPHKLIIKDVILNRIDKIYHEKIIGKDDPIDILKTLRLAKAREVPTTTVAARHMLHSIKYEHTKETADTFIQRFEQIIRAHDNLNGVDPISLAEKRDALYQAIRVAYPSVQHANFLCQTQNKRDLEYEELKKYIIEHELDKLQNADSVPKAVLLAKKQRKFDSKNDAYQSLNAKYVSSIQRITTKRIALGKVPVVRCATIVGKLSITWQQTVQRHGILQINKAINGNVVKGEARKEILAHV